MLHLTDEQMSDLARAVSDALPRDDLPHAIADIYQRVQTEIDQRKPVCSISGRCCRFEEYGHRLFATTIELAVFVRQQGESHGTDDLRADWNGLGCPFQVKGLCGVHAIRPFGCRIYF